MKSPSINIYLKETDSGEFTMKVLVRGQQVHFDRKPNPAQAMESARDWARKNTDEPGRVRVIRDYRLTTLDGGEKQLDFFFTREETGALRVHILNSKTEEEIC